MSFGACSCHGVTNSQQKLYLINLASLLLVEYLRRETSVKKKSNQLSNFFSNRFFESVNSVIIQLRNNLWTLENQALVCS